MPDSEDNYPPLPEPSYPGDSMPMYERTLAQAKEVGIAGAREHRPTITELLLHKKAGLEHELALVNDALAKAKEQSGAMALMDAVAKTRVHG